MAVFNGERFIEEQLRSILVQLRAEDEVIIVNDCSRDGSIEVIKGIRDPRIVLLDNCKNLGAAASFARAISLAKGEYIFLADQDDIWRADKVAMTRSVFETTNSLVTVSDARIVDADRSSMLGSMFSLRQSGPGFWRNLYRNGFVGCCMAIRSDTRAFLLPFPLKVGLHDEWIGLCASIAGQVSFIEQQLVDYRRHGSNVTQLKHGSLLLLFVGFPAYFDGAFRGNECGFFLSLER
jgi:glycosyltransferase involved in cell wall biosynthesis